MENTHTFSLNSLMLCHPQTCSGTHVFVTLILISSIPWIWLLSGHWWELLYIWVPTLFWEPVLQSLTGILTSTGPQRKSSSPCKLFFLMLHINGLNQKPEHILCNSFHFSLDFPPNAVLWILLSKLLSNVTLSFNPHRHYLIERPGV